MKRGTSLARGGAALACLLYATAPAGAVVTVYTSEADWLAAVEGVTTENFEASPLGLLAPGTTDIGAFSITIDNNDDGSVLIQEPGDINGTREFQGDVENDGATVLDFGAFGAPIAGFAGDWSSTATGDLLTVTIDGITISFEDFLPDPGEGFLGFVSSNPFSTMSFGTENPSDFGEAFQLDDALIAARLAVVDQVPEPSALALLGGGLLGVGLLFRCRRRAGA